MKTESVILSVLALGCMLSWTSVGEADDSTPVVKATINAVPEKTYPNSYGDIWVSTWADDNNTYTVCGDGWGFGYYSQWDWRYTQVVLSSLAGSDPDNLNGTVVHGLDAYSIFLTDPFDGSVKTMGITCIDGVLYVALNGMGAVGKQNQSIPIPSVYAWSAHNCTIVESTDHGATWTPGPADIGTNYTFPGIIFPTASFINYGKDGTNRPTSDQSDKYVYLTSNDTGWSDGDYYMLARILRSRFPYLDPADFEFYTGGDGMQDTNWTTDPTRIGHIIDNPGKCGMSCVQYDSALQRYIMVGWFFTEDYPTDEGYTVLCVYESPTPWGPWTVVGLCPTYPYGWYDPGIWGKFTSADGKTMKLAVGSAAYLPLQFVSCSVLTMNLYTAADTLPPSPKNSNLNLLKPVTASSAYLGTPAYAAERVNDGNKLTRTYYWQPNTSSNEWVVVDFGRTESVNRTEIFEFSNVVQNYKIQYWDQNSSSWLDAVANGGSIGADKVDNFPEIQTSKLRLYIVGTTNNQPIQILEFQAYDMDLALSATAGNGQVSLNWNPSSGAITYNVKRASASGGPYTTIAYGLTTTNYTDTGLNNGTTYYYVISDISTTGEGANSSEVSATPSANTPPPAPTGLSATAGNAQVSLSWNASPGATSYNVKRATINGGPYTTIASPATTSYTDTGLNNGTNYYYVVSAVNSFGESANSSQVGATPAVTPPPSAPTGLSATPGNGQVLLSWNASSGATRYNVKRATISGGPYTTIASPATTSYTDTGLNNGTNYYYVVSAVNSFGEGGNSSQVSATPAVTPPPSAPTGLSATPGNGQVLLSWNASSGATSYNVKRATVSGGPYTTIASPTGTSYTDTGLNNGTNYYYVVSAVNSSGESVNSSEVGATPAAGGGLTPITGSTLNSLIAGLTDVALASGGATATADTSITGYGPGLAIDGIIDNTPYPWNGPSDTTAYPWIAVDVNISGISPDWLVVDFHQRVSLEMIVISGRYQNRGAGTYTFQYTTDPSPVTHTSSWTTIGTYVWSSANPLPRSGFQFATVANVTGVQLVSAPNYTYNNGYGGGGWGNSIQELEAYPPTGVPPPAPTGLSATAGNAQVSLIWSAVSGATSYNVKRATVSGGSYTTIATGVTATNYTNIGLNNSSTYYYVVSAVNSFGESANSGEVSATPLPPPPAPTGLSATPGNGQVSLSWSSSSGATSYNVKRATVSGGPYSTVATAVTTTNYTNIGLTNGATYYYVVSAVNSSGEGANSSEVSATPLAGPPPPNELTGSSLTNGVFSFILNGAVGSNYVIEVSSDLVQWTPFSTNTIPPAGWLLIVDPTAGSQQERFYRTVIP